MGSIIVSLTLYLLVPIVLVIGIKVFYVKCKDYTHGVVRSMNDRITLQD